MHDMLVFMHNWPCSWSPEAYFRIGQAQRGLRKWEVGPSKYSLPGSKDALAAFREGRFREPANKEG